MCQSLKKFWICEPIKLGNTTMNFFALQFCTPSEFMRPEVFSAFSKAKKALTETFLKRVV